MYQTPSRSQVGELACPACGSTFSEQTNFCPKDGTQLTLRETGGPHLIPNFECGEEIGCGGMGVVYKARHAVLGKWFAIKMLPEQHLDRVGILRFQQEARAASKLHHENVVSVHDCGVTTSGRVYMVMEYAPGETLAEMLRRKGHLTIAEALPIFIQICAGVHHAHSQGILHRDLKPSNVVLVDTGKSLNAKILDFGIAKILDGEVRLERGLTQTGEVFGSPPYMSPEQALGKASDRRTDIYSLGCLMYEVLTGAPPIVGQSIIETIYKQIHEKPLSLKEGSLGQDFPQELEAIVAKALAKDVDRRFASVEELEQALIQLQSGQSVLPATQKSDKSNTDLLLPVSLSLIGLCVLLSLTISFSVKHQALGPISSSSENAAESAASKISRGNHLAASNHYWPAREASESVDALENLPESPDDVAEQTVLRSPNRTSYQFSRLRVTDGALSAFKQRDNVTDLRLASTKVDDLGVDSIFHLPLTGLDLSDTRITDSSLRQISKMPSLRELHIQSCRITDDGLNFLTKLKQLSDLFMGSNAQMTDRSWLTLSKMKSLSVLDLSGNKNMSEMGLREIASLPLLTNLCLTHMRITNKSAEVIRCFTHLRSLDLSGTAVGDAFISALAPLQLEHLAFYQTHISDKAFINFYKHKQLRTLRLGGSNQDVTDVSVKEIARLPNLRTLWIDEEYAITDQALAYLGQCRTLEELSLISDHITDAGLKELDSLPHLTKLELGGTRITDAGVDSLLKHDLTELALSRTLISDRGLLRLAKLKSLKQLWVKYNPAISPETLAEFEKQLPSCSLNRHVGPYTDVDLVNAGALKKQWSQR